MDASHREPSQVHAIRGQTASQVTPSLQLAITCNSVWPKNYRMHWAIFKQLLMWLSIYIFVARWLVSRSTLKNFVEVVERGRFEPTWEYKWKSGQVYFVA